MAEPKGDVPRRVYVCGNHMCLRTDYGPNVTRTDRGLELDCPACRETTIVVAER